MISPMVEAPPPDENITELLQELKRGRSDAEAELVPLIYDELRRLARTHMAWERPDHTLQTTALVHEAYVKLIGTRGTEWADRSHFFAVAAEIMRQILVDHARARRAKKRFSGAKRVELTDALAISDESLDRILMVDGALQKLKEEDPRQAQVVVLRFFAGLDIEQVADILGVSSRTVRRDWRHAKAWLYEKIAG